MIEPRAVHYGLLAALLVGFGLAIGNAPLVVWGLVVGGALAAAVGFEAPGQVQATVAVQRQVVRVGDQVRIEVQVVVRRGMGPLLVRVPLPDALQLAAGANLALMWKGPRPVRRTLVFRVRAAKRGPAEIGPVSVHPIHLFRLRTEPTQQVTSPLQLAVEPRVRRTAKMRHVRGRAATLQPSGDASRLGPRGNEFEEVRQYATGDPLRNVNWKATARQSQDDRLRLMVNEFEPEGRKSIWLFLDAAAYMEIGSTHENALDHALEGALGILAHFVARGYRAGATLYHQPETRVFYPDVGTRQLRRLTQTLATVTAHSGGEGLDLAVLRTRGFLLRERPLVLLVTRPEADPGATASGLAQIRALTGHGPHATPIFLFAPTPVVHTLAGGHHPLTAAALQLAARGAYQELRRQGVRVLDWDPARMPLERLLNREMVAR